MRRAKIIRRSSSPTAPSVSPTKPRASFSRDPVFSGFRVIPFSLLRRTRHESNPRAMRLLQLVIILPASHHQLTQNPYLPGPCHPSLFLSWFAINSLASPDRLPPAFHRPLLGSDRFCCRSLRYFALPPTSRHASVAASGLP